MSQDRVQSLERPLDEVSLEGRFEDLVARCRAEQDQLVAIGRQANEILNELHAHARARANEIVASARSEAARLLADARREVADVEAQIARLRESQRETAERFDSTRRALEAEVADLEAQITRLRESEREAAERLDSTRRALEAQLLEMPAPRPAHRAEAPAHRVEAPAHRVEAPAPPIEAPAPPVEATAHATEAPTRPIEVPTQAIGAPERAIEARLQAIGAPEHDIEARLQAIKVAVHAIEAPALRIEGAAPPNEGPARPAEEPIPPRSATAVATTSWPPPRTYIEIPPAGQEADDETSSLTAFKVELHRSPAFGFPGRVFVKPAIVVLAAAALVAAVGITIAWMSGGSESDRPSASPPAAGAPSSAPADRPEDRPAATPAAMTSATAPAPEPAALTSGGSADEAPAGAPSRGELEVRLEARRPSWIRATIDGVSENGYVLKAGETRMLSANANISVRAGDAGALLVSVNGGKPAPLGRDGQVLTRHFGRSPAAAAPAPKAEGNSERPTTPEGPTSQPSPPAAAARNSSTPQPAAPPLPAPVAPSPSAPAASLKTEGLTPPGPPTTVRQQILQADRQWFDAYYRGDKAMLSRLNAPGFEIVDERPPALRFSAGAQVRARALSDVRVDTHGDGAVLSARMIERVVQDGRTGQYESYVSEIWIRRDGQWRLMGLRLASAGQVEDRAAEAEPVP